MRGRPWTRYYAVTKRRQYLGNIRERYYYWGFVAWLYRRLQREIARRDRKIARMEQRAREAMGLMHTISGKGKLKIVKLESKAV